VKTFLTAKWQNLIMVNYEIDSSYLLPYLPNGVELDYFQGKTYVSLVGFLFKDSKIFSVPIPFLGTFEEVNLRFYVIRKVGNSIRRGVVFINETVPNKTVAYVANKLYKEHYTSVPTKHEWQINKDEKRIEYNWYSNKKWFSMKVRANATSHKMKPGSIESFIFEHYFGFTKLDGHQSIEYKVNHPSWEIHDIQNYQVDCNFSEFYGENFGILNSTKPHSVMLAEGSDVSIDWKRKRF
jgi:uncharacterized protein YqjF (DUF2071 family)